MDIIMQRGMFIRAFSFGKILCLSKTSIVLNLWWTWTFWIVSSNVPNLVSWATNSMTFVYNTLKMKQIPTLNQRSQIAIMQMQDLKIWNQTSKIEMYDGFGFTTWSICAIPPIYPMDWNIASWKWNTKMLVPLILSDSNTSKKIWIDENQFSSSWPFLEIWPRLFLVQWIKRSYSTQKEKLEDVKRYGN
jgi:hypothetical protein